jgi:hypothetical protein
VAYRLLSQNPGLKVTIDLIGYHRRILDLEPFQISQLVCRTTLELENVAQKS